MIRGAGDLWGTLRGEENYITESLEYWKKELKIPASLGETVKENTRKEKGRRGEGGVKGEMRWGEERRKKKRRKGKGRGGKKLQEGGEPWREGEGM